MKKTLLAVGILCAVAGSAHAAGMEITEWMYKGSNGEFVEFTNMGTTSIDMTGWYWSDSTYSTPHVAMSGIGIVKPGESVIYTETTPTGFRSNWGLASTVQIWGPNSTDNIGSGDAIRLYNGGPGVGVLVDQLTYGSPSTSNRSCTIPVSGLALTSSSSSWTTAYVGDAYGSWASSAGDVGNPGTYYAAPAVPEPSSILAILSGLTGLLGFAAKRRN